MRLETYRTLIKNLPVRQQCFTTKRQTWLNAENHFELLRHLNDQIFQDNPTSTISRQDIFDENNIVTKIIKTIYWGYPRGMRGNHFYGILNGIDTLVNSLNHLINNGDISKIDFQKFIETINQINGLGFSTYSKILYFNDIEINKKYCLILDKRLIDVFNNQIFEDFSFPRLRIDNAPEYYTRYLEQMNLMGNELNVNSEKIEQFLWIFGNNIK